MTFRTLRKPVYFSPNSPLPKLQSAFNIENIWNTAYFPPFVSSLYTVCCSHGWESYNSKERERGHILYAPEKVQGTNGRPASGSVNNPGQASLCQWSCSCSIIWMDCVRQDCDTHLSAHHSLENKCCSWSGSAISPFLHLSLCKATSRALKNQQTLHLMQPVSCGNFIGEGTDPRDDKRVLSISWPQLPTRFMAGVP